VVSTLGPIDNGFFGWTSSAAFDSFRITAGTNVGVAETFEMDNLAFVVPEPGTFLLAAAGLCLVGLRKKILLTYCKIRT
jgi:hypothetical protein